jgi:hypothetical protein
MAKKRTKLDKSQRQSNQLEKKAERHPEQAPKKGPSLEDFNQAAARGVQETKD